jgi:hypothetical protein
MITAQWLTGFRISEIFSLTVGAVYRHGAIVEKIGIAPKNLKGHQGQTRWVLLRRRGTSDVERKIPK